jgi:hypothetical protein
MEMMKRLNTTEGEYQRERETKNIDKLLSNDFYHSRMFPERFAGKKEKEEHSQEYLNKDRLMKMARGHIFHQLKYNGRMSPIGKEELYRSYLKGMTVKDLSLKYGILP